MEIPRKIGIGIVMIVPTFVVAGALWNAFHNWPVIFIWVLLMIVFSGALIAGKFSNA